MRVEVQIVESRKGAPEARPTIGSRGLGSLRELRDALPDSPLREAIGRLISRREGLDRQDQAFQREEGKDD
jgi:hypothetical protein